MAAEGEENAGTRARAGMRDERRDRAREDGAASWRATRRTDMAQGKWSECRHRIILADKSASVFAEKKTQNAESTSYFINMVQYNSTQTSTMYKHRLAS